MEEASILNFPAISLRDSTERSEGMEKGVLIMTGFNRDKLINGINVITKNNKEDFSKLVNDYFGAKHPGQFLVHPTRPPLPPQGQCVNE